ncbi:MAG: hypothetical protein ACOYOE_04225 [Chlorobium sp.]
MAMKQSLRAPAVWCLLLLVFLSGCASSQQCVMLARDGAAYTGAVSALVDRASAVRVESSSYTLHQERSGLLLKYKGQALKNASSDLLKQANQSDLGAIENNRQTKDVAISLQNYFIALQELAASTARVDIGSKTSELIAKLDDAMRTESRGSFLVSQSVAPVLVTHITERALRKELNSRKQVILRALQILDGLLITITREIEAQTKNIRKAREALLVQQICQDTISASTLSLSDKELWVNLRQKDLLGSTTEDDDKKAIISVKNSGRKFRELFMNITSK